MVIKANKMKQKSFFGGLAIAAIVLSILSLAAVTKVFSANPQNLVTNLQPQAAQFLPKRSPLVASFLFNPEDLSLAAKLATKVDDRRNFNQELSKLKTQLQQTWHLNYDQDLKPWIGKEATFAVTATDLDRDPSNGLQPGYLIALATEKPDLAQKYLERFWQKQAQTGADLTFEQYQGVSLVSTQLSAEDSDDFSLKAIANARVGKFILFANEPSVIRNAINNLQVPNLALASSPEYQNSLKQFTNQGWAIAYLNPSEIIGLAIDYSTKDDLPVTLTMGFKSSDLGIKVETILALSAKSSLIPSNPNAGIDILKYIQGGSSVIIGNDLAQTIKSITQSDRPGHLFLQQAITNLKQSIDFTLTPETLSWITDQYAIAIPASASTETKGSNWLSSWLLVVENKNPEQAISALTQLDQDARTKSKFTVGEIFSNKQPVTLWTKLNPSATNRTVTGTVSLAHTSIEKYVLFSNSVSNIENALSNTSILETDLVFKAIANAIGTQNGLVYLNSHELHNLLTLQPALNIFQNRIQSLAIANTKITSSSDTTFLNGQMILNWATNKS